MTLVVSALIINWLMISITHIFFRNAKIKEGVTPKFKAFWFPVSNYICLVFLLGILLIMLFTGMHWEVALIPVWLIVLFIGYKIYDQNSNSTTKQPDETHTEQ